MPTPILACDLGGSSLRAALVDARGITHATHAIPTPPCIDTGPRSEFDPAIWWAMLLEACAALAATAPETFAQTAAIAICGLTRTQVFVNHASHPVRPAIAWRDTRATATATRLQARLPAAHPETAAINAFHPLARLAWMAEHEPDLLRQVAQILDPKDYLNARLTGRCASDPISMARLLASTDILEAAGSSPAILPPILEPGDTVGPLRPNLRAPLDRLAGIPVFCGANDTWAAAAGLGALRPGYGYNISGTTEVLGIITATPAYAEGLVTVDWRSVSQLGGPSQTGADTVSWLLTLLGREASPGPDLATLLAAPRDPEKPLFLPYLQGERTPYWDATLRGAFLGLNRRHGPTDLAFAVLEGVAFLNRIVLERAEAAANTRISEIRFGGGGAANPVWAQIKADICNRPIVVCAAPEPGILGAAMLAWTGLGAYKSLAEAQEAMVQVAARYDPDPDQAAIYDRLFTLFRQAEAALAPISRALAAG